MAKKKIPFGDVLDQALNAANLAVGLVPDPVGSPLKGTLDIVTRIRQNFVRVGFRFSPVRASMFDISRSR
jgi:hypothetical protein